MSIVRCCGIIFSTLDEVSDLGILILSVLTENSHKKRKKEKAIQRGNGAERIDYVFPLEMSLRLWLTPWIISSLFLRLTLEQAIVITDERHKEFFHNITLFLWITCICIQWRHSRHQTDIFFLRGFETKHAQRQTNAPTCKTNQHTQTRNKREINTSTLLHPEPNPLFSDRSPPPLLRSIIIISLIIVADVLF